MLTTKLPSFHLFVSLDDPYASVYLSKSAVDIGQTLKGYRGERELVQRAAMLLNQIETETARVIGLRRTCGKGREDVMVFWAD